MSDRREQLNDPEESLRMAIEGAMAGMWTALPGIVNSVNLTAQTVSVQPSIQGSIVGQDGLTTNVNLPLLVDVPIVFPRAGGFAVTFPVIAGDECLVVFSSRCIDGWWQSGGVQRAMEDRMHDLSDGFCILGPTSQSRKLSNIQTDGVELRTEDRSTFLRVTNGTIYITGNIVHTGNQTSSGTITGTTDVIGGGKSLKTHVHSGVTAGGSNTGAPV